MAKAGNDSTPSARDRLAVAKTLPAGADREAWLAELERIRRDKLSSRKLAAIFKQRAQQDCLLLQSAPVTAEEQAQLERDLQWSREQAQHHNRLIGDPRRRRESQRQRQLHAILWLWQQHAGDPLITDRTVLAKLYLQAATRFVFGKAVSASTAKDIIRRYRHRNFTAGILRGEGAMSTDDSKIFVIAADGTVRR
jgi:hypothetical protein